MRVFYRCWVVVFVCALATAVSAGDGFSIKKVFESSPISVKVLVATDKEQRVKCAVYDAAGEPIRVDDQWVSPPLDEVMIITEGSTSAVKSAKCWVME